jgi:hypothetical protein
MVKKNIGAKMLEPQNIVDTPPPSTITFSVNQPEPNIKVMEITKDGIWVNPDVSVDDTAKAVLNALDVYIKKLVKEVVHQEREACINIIETYRIPVGNSASGELACEWTYAALHEIRDDIRARGETK